MNIVTGSVVLPTNYKINPHDESPGKLTIPIEAGALIRGQLRRAIKSNAIGAGLSCEIEEDKGFLESLLIFRLTGPMWKLSQFKIWAEDLIRQNERITNE